ncbi:MAG: CpaF family protein [Anaerolineae bacterium]|nr:CpaF family protein [Anaerolineae bacterium]
MSLLRRIDPNNKNDQSASNPDTKKRAVDDLKGRIQARLPSMLDPTLDPTSAAGRASVEDTFHQLLSEESIVLSRAEKTRLFEQVAANLWGLGPLEPLFQDDNITEIYVNGANNIYVVRKGRRTKIDSTFEDDDHIKRVLRRLWEMVGQRLDDQALFAEAYLPYLRGRFQINVIMPPLATKGIAVAVWKFTREFLSLEDLLRFGSLTAELAEVLRACVLARFGILVTGERYAGKTTLLNILASFIPDDERIVTLEKRTELLLGQDQVMSLRTWRDEVTLPELVTKSLRFSPDRLVIGDVNAGEALSIVDAINFGHDGVLMAMNAQDPQDAIAQLEQAAGTAGKPQSISAIHEEIASAINLIIHVEHLRDGSRKITRLTEVCGGDETSFGLFDIFKLDEISAGASKATRLIRPTGIKPAFITRITDAGIPLPAIWQKPE